jgi:hypothetical protein
MTDLALVDRKQTYEERLVLENAPNVSKTGARKAAKLTSREEYRAISKV